MDRNAALRAPPESGRTNVMDMRGVSTCVDDCDDNMCIDVCIDMCAEAAITNMRRGVCVDITNMLP